MADEILPKPADFYSAELRIQVFDREAILLPVLQYRCHTKEELSNLFLPRFQLWSAPCLRPVYAKFAVLLLHSVLALARNANLELSYRRRPIAFGAA